MNLSVNILAVNVKPPWRLPLGMPRVHESEYEYADCEGISVCECPERVSLSVGEPVCESECD